MDKSRVLFVCIHNSARSQMAEALLNHFYGDYFQAESAGLEPGKLNPIAVAAMADIGIDISKKTTRGVFDLYKAGMMYKYVVTVCDEASAERCPLFPSATKTLHWSFEDPASFKGSDTEKLQKTILVRDKIKSTIAAWVHELNP
ncbi:MAG TPA: arsenate reductase ArsC [Bacteroidota bacterium]|nr:arsenate reductase ArsC [Bacteroidota bacterium]